MAVAHKLDFRLFTSIVIGVMFGYLLNMLLPIFARNPLFLLVLPVAALFFLFLIMRPKETLILLIIARPMMDRLLDYTKISVGGTQFSVGAGFNMAIILLGIFMAFYYKGFPRKNILFKCWIMYLLFMFFATVYSPYAGQAVRLLINQLTYFTMFMLPFILVKSREDFKFWLKVLAISFVLPVLAADWNLLHGGKVYKDAGMRVIGNFTHPNILAFYLVLGFTVYVYILKNAELKISRNVRIWMKLLMLNMLILLVATKTRNAWIGCFLGFFIYGLLKDRKVMIGLILLIPLSLTIPTVQERVVTIMDPSSAQSDYKGINSFEWRLMMWQSSLSWIAERPLQGYGLTSFKPLSSNFSSVGTNGAHNIYLELLFEAGIFALASFVLLCWNILLAAIKNMRQALDMAQARLWALVVGYWIAYMLMCSADNLLYYLAFNWYVWFFLGLVIAASRYPAVPAESPQRNGNL